MQSNKFNGSATQLGSKYSATGPEIQFLPSNASEDQRRSFEISNKDFPYKAGGFPTPIESSIWPELGRVYPLYYGEGHSIPTSLSQSLMNPQEQMAKHIFSAIKPSVQSHGTEFTIGNSLPSNGFDRVPDCNKTSKRTQSTECDLSLRLGLPSPPSSEVESSSAHEVEDVGSSSSCEGGKSYGQLPSEVMTMNLKSSPSAGDKGWFDFFSADKTDEHYESCSSKWSSQGDCAYYINGYERNQKVYALGALTGGLTDECFSWK